MVICQLQTTLCSAQQCLSARYMLMGSLPAPDLMHDPGRLLSLSQLGATSSTAAGMLASSSAGSLWHSLAFRCAITMTVCSQPVLVLAMQLA